MHRIKSYSISWSGWGVSIVPHVVCDISFKCACAYYFYCRWRRTRSAFPHWYIKHIILVIFFFLGNRNYFPRNRRDMHCSLTLYGKYAHTVTMFNCYTEYSRSMDDYIQKKSSRYVIWYLRYIGNKWKRGCRLIHRVPFSPGGICQDAWSNDIEVSSCFAKRSQKKI